MSLCGKDIDETKYISCLTTLLEKYNEIWKKVKNGLKKEFDSEPTYNEKYLKAKIKSYNRKVNTKKYKKRFFWLSVIFIYSVFRTGKITYPQVFLEEYKHAVKEKKVPKYIVDDK